MYEVRGTIWEVRAPAARVREAGSLFNVRHGQDEANSVTMYDVRCTMTHSRPTAVRPSGKSCAFVQTALRRRQFCTIWEVRAPAARVCEAGSLFSVRNGQESVCPGIPSLRVGW